MKPNSTSTDMRRKINGAQNTTPDKADKDNNVDHDNNKDRHMLKESLLMPTTSVGKTTSATICERSNAWAEQRLSERKHDLDKTLYKHIVKINSDRLQVVDELSKIKKSASTGHLDRLARLQARAHGNIRVSHDVKTKPDFNSPHERRRGSDEASFKTSKQTIGNQNKNVKTTKSASDHSIKFSITGCSDGGSSDESDSTVESRKSDSGASKNRNLRRGSCDLAFHSDALQLTPCLGYRGFIEDRHQTHMVESVGRRYAKQLSAGARKDVK